MYHTSQEISSNRVRTTYYTRKSLTAVPIGNILHPENNTSDYTITVDGFNDNIVYTKVNPTTYNGTTWMPKFVHNPEGLTRHYSYEEHYPFYFIKDHLGNIRETYIKPAPNTKYFIQNMQYYPSGIPWKTSTGAIEHPYRYNGKELILMHGQDEYDSKARWYYPAICRTTTMDPLCEKYYNISPYAWCGNNLANVVDFDGRNPVYSCDGEFLGVNELGLQGEALFMDPQDFYNGMTLEESMKLNQGTEVLSAKALSKYISHYETLSSRPDWDGVVTASEGVAWAKSHPNAIQNPTPDNMLYINAALLDFGNISISNCVNGIGEDSPINLLNEGNLKNSLINPALRNTVYALGRVNVVLLDSYGHVNIVNDEATDFDWNKGGGFFRASLILLERIRAGVSDTHGFKTFYYGVGSVKTK